MTSQQSSEKEVLSKSSSEYDLRIDVLFTRLGAIYGQLWWNNFRTESLLLLAKKEWSECLKDFDNQILKEVLVVYRENKNYPPVLPQFVENCRTAQARRITPSVREARTTNFNVARRHLSEIKMMLAR